MCSIIGYNSNQTVSSILVDALTRMEYRGYDSVGVATKSADGIVIRKGAGRVIDVNNSLHLDALNGNVGIGHTRWATHGGVNDVNAHPHLSADNSIAVVHNGIIENYVDLKNKLIKQGIEFRSDTDTEVIPNLLSIHFAQTKKVKQAMIRTVEELRGQYGFIALFADGTITAAKSHEPLIVGVGKDSGYFVSSDVLGFIDKTNDAIFLENEQFTIIDKNGFKIFNFDGKEANYQITRIPDKFKNCTKDNYAHFTLKEIFEQPATIIETANNNLKRFNQFLELIKGKSNLYITGSGTSYNAGLLAKYLFPLFTRLSPEPIMSSEFKYFEKRLKQNSVLIAISQSGESADVLEAVTIAKNRGLSIASILNSTTSSLARESQISLGLNCGPEIGVAATKSFTSQLVILYKLIQFLSNIKLDFSSVSIAIQNILKETSKIESLAHKIEHAADLYILGRGIHYPIAKEGALKIKELSYIHAEGFPTGELKHGPLALMDNRSHVIVINPSDDTYNDTISSIEEVKARGAKIIGLSDKNNAVYDYWIEIPKVEPILYPLVEIVPFQLLAYYLALERKQDPDYPRNLAKSVTVK